MGGWDQALDAQTDLLHSFKTESGSRYLGLFASQLCERGEQLIDGRVRSGIDLEVVGMMLRNTMASVMDGEPIWVSGDVVEIVEHAAESFMPEILWPDDLFVPEGFALLERPLRIADKKGKSMSYRAISWVNTFEMLEPGKPQGISFSLWSHYDDDDDFWAKRRMASPTGSSLVLAHSDYCRFGIDTVFGEVTKLSIMKQLQVLWRLAKQEIVVPESERVSRAVWRHAAREVKHVTVMRLRRTHVARGEGAGSVEWSHRWMVSGHWRRQPYKRDGVKVHKQLWISPYVKGPDDAPLVVKKRAVELVR